MDERLTNSSESRLSREKTHIVSLMEEHQFIGAMLSGTSRTMQMAVDNRASKETLVSERRPSPDPGIPIVEYG